MLFSEKLKREYLIDIVTDFKERYSSAKDLEEKILVINESLTNLENILNEYTCEYDDRFVTYCRRDFLRDEFTAKLNKKFIKLDSDYLRDAYNNLSDYVMCDTWISLGSIPNGVSAKDIIKKDEEYKQSGVICKQEKEILLSMIKEFQYALKSNCIL